MVSRYPNAFEMAHTTANIERIVRTGKFASLIRIEGGRSIEKSLGVLRIFHRLSACCVTLTHNNNLTWADSATDKPRHNRMTLFGEEVVRDMNWFGMLVNIAHVSADTMYEVLGTTRAPVIASHSSAFAICPHPKNVPYDILQEMKDNGGVIVVNFYLGRGGSPAKRATGNVPAVAVRVQG